MTNRRMVGLALCSVLSIGAAKAATGNLDSTFGSAGTVVTTVGGPTMFGPKVVVQPDGKVLVSGGQFNGKDYDFVVMRYLTNGALDTSFGSSGMAQIDFYGGNDIAKAMVLQPDGMIILAGEATKRPGGYGVHAVTRLTSSGALDTNFATSGKALTDFGVTSHIHGVALQADGKIIAVGETYTSTDGGAAAISRYNTDGSIDTTFGSAGKVTPFSNTTNSHVGLALADGNILIAGYNTPSGVSQPQCFVARLSAAGALDTAFGTAGITQIPVGAGANHCNAMMVQSDGKIILAGGAQMSATSNYDFALMRLSSQGQLDTSFGSAGITTTAFSSTGAPTNEEAADAIVQGDGKIVLGGYSNKMFALARYLSNGSPDTSFGSGGKVTLTLGGLDEWIKGVALQPDGRLVASGYSWNGSNYLIAMARLQNDSSAAPGSSASTSVCLFNWAERSYSQYFAPSGASSATYQQYYYRYYSATGNYLATSTIDKYIWLLGPVSGNALLKLMPVSDLLGVAGCN